MRKHTSKNRKGAPAGLRFLQGALIGLGAVLPGVSGGVLCVVFGVYRMMMSLFLSPFQTLRRHGRALLPLIAGGGFGFVVVARLLGFFLNKYPDQSVCLFVGLIGGMLPSLFREAGKKGRDRNSFISLGVGFLVVLALILSLNGLRVTITPNFTSYLFCGFCIALSVIVPGMSFSTLLMPTGLYTPLVTGIGSFDLGVLIPAGAGALLTVVLLAKAMNRLMERHYALAFHGIIGIVMAATVVIIPFRSFGGASCAGNLICLSVGVMSALALDRFNQSVEVSTAE